MYSRNKICYDEISIIDIYVMRKNNIIERFPPNFWGKSTARDIIRYIFIDELGLSRNEICKLNYRKELTKLKIVQAFALFDYSTCSFVTYCFPELQIKPWEMICLPNGYFDNKENVKEALRWLFAKKKINDRKVICEEFSADFLRRNGLKSLLDKYNLHQLLTIAVPEMDIKEWELNKLSFWSDFLIKKAVMWLIEDIKGWNYEQVCENISTKVFRDNGLGGMISKGCNNSTIIALQIAYPGVYSKDVLLGYKERI